MVILFLIFIINITNLLCNLCVCNITNLDCTNRMLFSTHSRQCPDYWHAVEVCW